MLIIVNDISVIISFTIINVTHRININLIGSYVRPNHEINRSKCLISRIGELALFHAMGSCVV